MRTRPNITVVIPTRERVDVLRKCLQTVTAQSYENLQILVSDNYSNDGTEEFVRATADPRVKYVNTGRRVSMSHNWEFALRHIDDGWVMVIGDDDGLLPNALDRVADLIAETGTSAIIPTCCTYIWPNAQNDHAGRLLVPMGRGHEVRDSREWLQRVVNGRAWYSELPMLYSGGVIKMDLLKSIRDMKGSFFQSCQPDIFSAIAIASATESYVYSREPFAIAGHSKHSNGASWSASGKQSSSGEKLEAVKKFLSEGNIPFHPDVPLNPDGSFPVSIDMLVYESYLQTAYIHHNALGITPAAQLKLFLARPLDDARRMQIWTKVFAQHHRLDIAATSTVTTSLRMRWDRAREYFASFRDFYRIEPSFGVRMRDVLEASIVADTVLRLRPSRIRSYLSTLRKWSGKTNLRLSAR